MDKHIIKYINFDTSYEFEEFQDTHDITIHDIVSIRDVSQGSPRYSIVVTYCEATPEVGDGFKYMVSKAAPPVKEVRGAFRKFFLFLLPNQVIKGGYQAKEDSVEVSREKYYLLKDLQKQGTIEGHTFYISGNGECVRDVLDKLKELSDQEG